MSTADTGAVTLPPGYEDVPHTVERLRARRRAIARNLTAAAAIPSLTADMQFDLTQLLAIRADWDSGPRPSVLAFLAKASVASLEDHPDLNATYGERELIRWSTVNLGVAVDAPGGLVVPVIRDAQTLSVSQIAEAVTDLATRARAKELALTDLEAGTFTLSNPGAVAPSLRAEALLNPPQVALLGLPGMRRIPVVVNDAGGERIEARSVLAPSLTFDHRALDGGTVLRYLDSVREKVEGWRAADYRATP